jgi:alpha-L-rhamnosidase
MVDLLAHPDRVKLTDPRPRFSWIVESGGKDLSQAAYQVRVTDAAGKTVWDSGNVLSDQSVAILYAGDPLTANAAYRWTVRIWDAEGEESAWSGAQAFQTGELRDSGKPFTTARYPVVKTAVPVVRAAHIAPGHWFLDFGRAAFGQLRLTLKSDNGGETVTVRLGERRDGKDRVHRKPGGSIRFHETMLTLRAGTHEYDVPLGPKDGRLMPPEVGPVMPFRYVEVEGVPFAPDPKGATQFAVHYPFDDSAASFTSSDKALNDIWELCRYSMKATSTFGVYVDGDRERLPYEADAYINQLGHYCTDREFTLARYTHEYLLAHHTWPTEWIHHSVLMAWADYLYSGDPESITAFYDDLKERTLYRLARPDGLISTQEPPVPPDVLKALGRKDLRDIVDWPMSERDGYVLRPVNTVVNAFYFAALTAMRRIAAALRKIEDARFFDERAAQVRETFNARLFDPARGVYVDGEGTDHSSQHANFFPLAFGLVPAERVKSVAAFVQGKGMACSVYAAQYLLEALYDHGLADHALQLMTARNTDRSWAHMVYNVGTTITLEAWDDKYKPNQDWNHAWGAAPANIIPRKLMGIEPLEPGFRRVRIKPQPGSLTRAQIKQPTVRGPITASFEASPSRFRLTVQLPANTVGEVHLPRLGRDDASLRVDGRPHIGSFEGGSVVALIPGGGTHRIERG